MASWVGDEAFSEMFPLKYITSTTGLGNVVSCSKAYLDHPKLN